MQADDERGRRRQRGVEVEQARRVADEGVGQQGAQRDRDGDRQQPVVARRDQREVDRAVVLDVGINRLQNGKLCGDVDFAGASERAGWITPVPGGVGPMTIASLLLNTVALAEARAEAG